MAVKFETLVNPICLRNVHVQMYYIKVYEHLENSTVVMQKHFGTKTNIWYKSKTLTLNCRD
jgi:hypothetical protein